MGSAVSRSRVKPGARDSRGRTFQRPTTRDARRIRRAETAATGFHAMRRLVMQQGHWVLVVLLAILFMQLSRIETVPRHKHDSPTAVDAVPDHSVATVSAPMPAAQGAASSLAVGGEADEAAERREESSPGRERAPDAAAKTISVMIEPSENGAYYLRGTINEQEVGFIVDTGASVIAIPERLRYSLKLSRGRYIEVSTAGGRVGTYETVVDRLSLGPLQFANVAGVLNPHAPNDLILLGMSALKDLHMVQSERRLTLTQEQRSPSAAEMVRSPFVNERPVPKRALRECFQTGQVIDRRILACMDGR